MSGRQVQRYVMLTELIPELLQLLESNTKSISANILSEAISF